MARTRKRRDRPAEDVPGFDLWLYHAGAGWWLDERGLDSAITASNLLALKVGDGNVVAEAVLPAGHGL